MARSTLAMSSVVLGLCMAASSCALESCVLEAEEISFVQVRKSLHPARARQNRSTILTFVGTVGKDKWYFWFSSSERNASSLASDLSETYALQKDSKKHWNWQPVHGHLLPAEWLSGRTQALSSSVVVPTGSTADTKPQGREDWVDIAAKATANGQVWEENKKNEADKWQKANLPTGDHVKKTASEYWNPQDGKDANTASKGTPYETGEIPYKEYMDKATMDKQKAYTTIVQKVEKQDTEAYKKYSYPPYYESEGSKLRSWKVVAALPVDPSDSLDIHPHAEDIAKVEAEILEAKTDADILDLDDLKASAGYDATAVLEDSGSDGTVVLDDSNQRSARHAALQRQRSTN